MLAASPRAQAAVHRPFLSRALAERAITAYEHGYWKAQGMTVKVDHCQRHSALQVTCLAEAAKQGETVIVQDWATLLPHEIVRIHPGSETTTITME
jgi:hypothetical protein